MWLRILIYVVGGLFIVILGGLLNTSTGLKIDYAWLLIMGAIFSVHPESGLICAVLFGLTLDGLSGSGTMIYTLGYGGVGFVIYLIRRLLFLKGYTTGWIVAVAGSQLLWIVIAVFARALQIIGFPIIIPGWISPFLLSVLFGYPVAYMLAIRILDMPERPVGDPGYKITIRTPG